MNAYSKGSLIRIINYQLKLVESLEKIIASLLMDNLKMESCMDSQEKFIIKDRGKGNSKSNFKTNFKSITMKLNNTIKVNYMEK